MTDTDTNKDRETHGRLQDAKETMTHVYETTVDKASSALGSSKEVATDAARRTAESLESNPLGILVGGLAVGAIAGALIPRSTKEKELLAPLGKQIGERARAAIAAAREAGTAELDGFGINQDAARDQVRTLLGNVAKAAQTAGAAAVKSAANKG